MQVIPRSEKGATIVEYALLLSLIAVLCMGALGETGRRSKEALQRASLPASQTGGGRSTHGASNFNAQTNQSFTNPSSQFER